MIIEKVKQLKYINDAERVQIAQFTPISDYFSPQFLLK